MAYACGTGAESYSLNDVEDPLAKVFACMVRLYMLEQGISFEALSAAVQRFDKVRCSDEPVPA